MNEKKQTAPEQQDDAYYEALSQWAESDEAIDPPGATWQRATPETRAAARAMLAEVMSPDELAAAERRGPGRPRLSGAGTGRSPKRQVRLPDELDAQLVARATAEGRTPSAVMRDAVAAYMRTA